MRGSAETVDSRSGHDIRCRAISSCSWAAAMWSVARKPRGPPRSTGGLVAQAVSTISSEDVFMASTTSTRHAGPQPLAAPDLAQGLRRANPRPHLVRRHDRARGMPDAPLVSMRALVLATLIACSPTTPSVPWLYGLSDPVASESGSLSTMQRLADTGGDVDEACGADAYRGIELAADVAPAAGQETIVAAYARGIHVFDRSNHLVAATPGYYCVGFSDEITALAAGTAYGKSLIVVVTTSGGRRERETSLHLFRIVDRRLAPAFSAR